MRLPNRPACLRPLPAMLGTLLVLTWLAGCSGSSAKHSASSSPPPGVVYAALGDSYSAGVGAGTPLSGDANCDRSANAYPYLWNQAHHPASFAFLACSGATIPQTATQVSAMPTDTTLVSITDGGNDIGFSQVVLACTLQTGAGCTDTITSAATKVRTQLPSLLDGLFASIAARAPKARLLVLGYPHFFDSSATTCSVMSAPIRAEINAGIDLLDETIRTAAAKHHATFLDPRAAFAAHGICAAVPWLHAIDTSDLSGSFHPTADGQRQGYLPLFNANA